MQREILRQIAVLNDRLYMGIRAEQVLPGATAAKRPDAAHWQTVMVSAEPFCLLAAGAHKCVSSKYNIQRWLACALAPCAGSMIFWLLVVESWSVLLSCEATRTELKSCDSRNLERAECLRPSSCEAGSSKG